MGTPGGPIWDDAKMAYSALQRRRIMDCIHRLNAQEARALEGAVMKSGHQTVPRPWLRQEIREWYRQRWSYLVNEYEKVLPHVSELPPDVAGNGVLHDVFYRSGKLAESQ